MAGYINLNEDKQKIKFNLLIAGNSPYDGTDLIETIFNITKGNSKVDGIDLYENDDARIYTYNTKILDNSSVQQYVNNQSFDGTIYQHIHAIWYCINTLDNEEPNWEYMNELYKLNIPFFVVLTHCIFVSDVNEKKKLVNKYFRDILMIGVNAKEDQTYEGKTIPVMGIEDLKKYTQNVIPSYIQFD